MHLSRSRHQNVRFPCNSRRVSRLCMTGHNCGILVHKHHRYRSSDYKRPSDYCRFGAFDIHAVKLQNFHNRLGCARRKSNLGIGKNPCKRAVCASVDILRRIQHLTRLFIIQLLRKRSEHEDSVNAVILIQSVKGLIELLLSNVGRKNHIFHLNAHLFAALHGAPLI